MVENRPFESEQSCRGALKNRHPLCNRASLSRNLLEVIMELVSQLIDFTLHIKPAPYPARTKLRHVGLWGDCFDHLRSRPSVFNNIL